MRNAPLGGEKEADKREIPQGRGKGDLFVVVEVKTPTNLTPHQRELLREFKSEANKLKAATGT